MGVGERRRVSDVTSGRLVVHDVAMYTIYKESVQRSAHCNGDRTTIHYTKESVRRVRQMRRSDGVIPLFHSPHVAE